MECSPLARLLFVGMWNFADDLGRLALSPKTIKAQIFPSDDISSENIRGMIAELSKNGLVLVYEAKGKDYLQVTGWHHQRIDKPQPGKCPAPTNGFKSGPDPSFRDHSTNSPRTFADGKEGKGRDSNSEATASGADAPPDPSIAERELFKRGREILGKSAGGQIAKLLKAKGGNVALARSALEAASTKQNPAEYVAAAARDGPRSAKPVTEFQRKQQETKDVLDGLKDFVRRGSGRGAENPQLLRDHSGERPESLFGRDGGNVVDV